MVIAIVVVVAVAKLFNVLNAFNSSAIPFQHAVLKANYVRAGNTEQEDLHVFVISLQYDLCCCQTLRCSLCKY